MPRTILSFRLRRYDTLPCQRTRICCWWRLSAAGTSPLSRANKMGKTASGVKTVWSNFAPWRMRVSDFMLTLLNISNITLIDQLRVEFDRGLTLLTGETGSGKSIIVDALGVLIGGRVAS